MAIVSLAASEMRYGIVQQTLSFGTAMVDAVTVDNTNNGSEVQTEHFDIQDMINVRDDPEANGVRYQTLGEVLVDTKEAMPTFTMEMPTIRGQSIDLFLAAYFQNVTEEAATPFKKTFTIPISGATQQPDFSSDAGFFFTVFERHPIASRSRKVHDAICQTLTLAAEPGGKINLNVEMVARGTVDYQSNPSGTWTRDESAGFHYSDPVKSYVSFDNGVTTVNVDLKDAWEVALSQTIGKCGFESGTFTNFAITERTGTFSLTFNDDANTLTAFANATAGTALEVGLGWGSGTPGSTVDDLDIVFRGKLTEDPVRDKEGIMGTVLTGKILGNSTTASPITVIHANAIDRAW